MNDFLRARLVELKQSLGSLFYRCAIPGGLLTIWPTDEGWMAIAVPDRANPRGELRTVPIEGSNRHFRFRIHYPDDNGRESASAWQHLIETARDG